jgi:CHAT domain-containing protein
VEFHKALLAANRNSEHIRGSAEALRQAALKVLRTPGYSHPFYWAAFIVIGAGW